jgi:hypothetical protein
MKVYYALWKGKEHRFDEPVPYDFTFQVNPPHLVLRAKDLGRAKAKIEQINTNVEKKDRFDLKITTRF